MSDTTDDRGDQDKDDKVGYGRPPKSGQFKPGQSGNPRGRPKGAKGLRSLFIEELRRPVTVTEGGRTRKISRAKAIAIGTIHKAANGDMKALNFLVGADREHHPATPLESALPRQELDPIEAEELDAFIRRIRSTSDADIGSLSAPTGSSDPIAGADDPQSDASSNESSTGEATP